jgi:hypothetical protein
MSLNSHRLLLLFPHTTTKYYFDFTNGNDNNTGLRTGDPFKTIAKLNTLPLVGDDTIFLKRGEIWREMISMPDHGEGYINFKPYGDGTNPIISGSSLNHSLYLIYPYFTFKDIIFNGAIGANNETASVFTHDVTFNNCEFRNSANYIGASAYTDAPEGVYNVHFINCTAHDNYTSGIFIGASGGVVNCTVQGGTYYSNGHSVDLDHGVYVKFGTSVIGVTAYNNKSAGIKINCEGVYTSANNPLIERCVSYNNYFGYYVGHNKAVIQNNIAYGNTVNNIYCDTDARDNYIYNNTLVNSVNTGIKFDAIVTGAHNIIKNNIFVEDAVLMDYQYVMDVSNMTLNTLAANNTFNNNLYYADGDTSSPILGGLTLAQWKALTGSPDATNSTIASPVFRTNYTDFHLQSSSPCKTTGANIGVNIDYDGIPRSTTPSFGAYEYR